MDLNEHKGGWHNLTYEQLLILLHQEMLELSKAIFTSESPRAIGYEAADVACFAMMIADNAGAYKDRPHATSMSTGMYLNKAVAQSVLMFVSKISNDSYNPAQGDAQQLLASMWDDSE
jgi:hypothetical protein